MYFRGKDCSKNNSLLERVDSSTAHMEAPGNGLLIVFCIDPFASVVCHFTQKNT